MFLYADNRLVISDVEQDLSCGKYEHTATAVEQDLLLFDNRPIER